MHDSNESQVVPAPILPLAKAEGALLALAAGDALGWPQEVPRNSPGNPANKGPHVEFEGWTRRSGGRFQPFEESILPGEYSDDTQLTLAVARSRTNHGSAWWKAFTQMELPLWTLYERGGGGATKRAAHAWANGHPPWRSKKKEGVARYFAAGGNGVTMRVLPHALLLAGEESASTLMHDVILDGSATHGHPRALVGATVYACAARSLARRNSTLPFGELLDTLLDDKSTWGRLPTSNRDEGTWFAVADEAMGGYESLWDQTVHEMRVLLDKAKEGLRAGALADDYSVLRDLGCFGQNKGAGTVSTAAAVYLVARHAAQPVQGILRAAFEKGADTDTLAAMTGGLIGCLSGVEWLPAAWLQVQDAEYLRKIASRIAQGTGSTDQTPVESAPDLEAVFSNLPRQGEGELNLSGTTRALATVLADPKPIAKSIAVRAWRLRTSDGQTMYVTKVERLTTKAPARQPIHRAEDSSRPASSITASSDVASDLDSNPKNLLYMEFCRQLQAISRDGEMKRKDLESMLGLVPGQAREWLEQAERDGRIRMTSKKPVKFALTGKQPSLL